MRNVDEAADEVGDSKFDALPERVRVALGELAGAAKEGLLALSVGVGLGVLTELMAEEVDDTSSVRGAATTLSVSRCVTAMRTAVSRSVAGGCQCSVLGCARLTAAGRSR